MSHSQEWHRQCSNPGLPDFRALTYCHSARTDWLRIRLVSFLPTLPSPIKSIPSLVWGSRGKKQKKWLRKRTTSKIVWQNFCKFIIIAVLIISIRTLGYMWIFLLLLWAIAVCQVESVCVQRLLGSTQNLSKFMIFLYFIVLFNNLTSFHPHLSFV